MATFIRGYNPVWSMVDLTGNQLDDTYYLFVLQNTIPYLPETVYHDEDGNTPWTQPIQFLANGTLPVDIFFDPDVVYRLEVRQGNTSSDPLIYLVEDYTPGTSGTGPIDNVGLASDNQITNPQFSIVSFSSPFMLTNVTDPDPIEVAPGWFLVLTGTGNVTLEHLPLNSTLENQTNAPYAVRITLTGTWTGVPFLRQRFNQNGMLWANKYVSSSITARTEGASVDIAARIDDSLGNPLATVLDTVQVDNNFEEYTGVGLLPDTVNTDVPPDAYIDYKLLLPTTCDIYVTSFQLIASEIQLAFAYEQDTIERQVDHTFHYYRESIIYQPKQTLLAGFNFGLNPWQFRTRSDSNLATFGYTADQVIAIQQAYVDSATGNNIQVGRAGVAENYGFKVTAVTANNQFALIEYIDPANMRPYWGNTLSMMVKLNAQKQTPASDLQMKARLIYRSSLPPTLAQAEPIATWAANGEPVFAAGWTEIEPKNDPVYNLAAGDNIITFEGMTLPAADNANMTLGVVLYTIDPMIESGTPDNIIFYEASLIPNDFAMEASVLTFNEVLSRCQFYYQKSFPVDTLPANNAGVLSASLGIQVSGAGAGNSGGPNAIFRTMMRTSSPTITLHNPQAPNAQIYNNGIGASWSNSVASFISEWGFKATGTTPGGSGPGNGSQVHWTANGQLG